MATIQARKGIDENGKQRTRYRAQVRLRGFPPATATFERKTDAKEWAQATEADMRDGRYFPARESKRRTLGDLVDRQLEVIKSKRPHDYGRQQVLLGWWKAKLGDYTLAQVTPALIAEHRDRLQTAEHFGPGTVNRYLAALSKAFTDAVREWHWLHDNPLRRVSKETEPSGRVRYLADDEREALLAACKKSELPELHLIVLLALTTGMRRGEILGLRWPDVDLERRVAVLHDTKNGDKRSVPIVPAVAALLIEHGKVRRLDSDLVFPGPAAKEAATTAPGTSAAAPAKSDASKVKAVFFDKHWYAALAAAKVKDFRFHDLRHTTASYLAMSGATTPEIAAVLGHRTLQMVKRYAHLSDQHTGAVIERMTRKYFKA